MIPPIEDFNNSATKDIIALVIATDILSQNGAIEDLQ